MAKYTATIRLGSKSKSRFAKRSKTNYSGRSWGESRTGKSTGKVGFMKKLSKIGDATIFRMKLKKIFVVLLTAGVVALLIATMWALSYLQKVSAELPSPDDPFGEKNTASLILDRNGKELYKVFGEENRDQISLDEIPERVRWVFLAAEDVDFYNHPGFDAVGIARCGVNNYILRKGQECGGSTITQQMVKLTVLTNEKKLERKIKELLLSLQVERKYTKDEILEIYLNVIPFGSNIYGIKTASEFYFGKEPKDLTLAEATLLAGIPQNPVYNSPTIAPDPEQGKQNAKNRQENYVLKQLEEKQDKVNSYLDEEDQFTTEQIEAAKTQELVYQAPRINIKAPHFVFYVQELLQQRGYNDGIPFDLSDIETGGYKIYTTLDYDLQQVTEENVTNAANVYGKRHGASNAALMTIRPGTGEILTMVGSKNYWGASEPAGCTAGRNCRFEGKVNIATALNSPGSTAKPIAYYTAFDKGILAPGSYMADVPIDIRGYRPKNSDSSFFGINTARIMLAESRNIPAIVSVEAAGVQSYIDNAVKFGYTTFNNPAGYGPSIAIGGSDVKMVEHAQGFGVFANGRDFVQNEAIMRIEDKKGKVIFEHKPEKKEVANKQAIFLVNDSLNPKSRSGKSAPVDTVKLNDGRDIAAKTGTSEDHKDTWYAIWSPDFVTLGWLGNNDNTPMVNHPFGSTSVRPWVSDYMKQIMGSFPEKTPFFRPGGVVVASGCPEGATDCDAKGDLIIEGKAPPSYLVLQKAEVCTDQQDRLAREIDKQTGNSIEKTFKSVKMPVESLQKFVDAYLFEKGNTEYGVPTEYCDINRNPGGGTTPWATISSPAGGSTISGTFNAQISGFSTSATITKMQFSLGACTSLSPSSTLSSTFSGSITASCSLENGSYPFTVTTTDSTGATGVNSVYVIVGSAITPNLNVSAPSNPVAGDVNVTASYSGGSGPLSNVTLVVVGALNTSIPMSGGYSATWSATPGDYTLYVTATNSSGGIIRSSSINVTVGSSGP